MLVPLCNSVVGRLLFFVLFNINFIEILFVVACAYLACVHGFPTRRIAKEKINNGTNILNTLFILLYRRRKFHWFKSKVMTFTRLNKEQEKSSYNLEQKPVLM
jgi:hypothetical protein